MMLRHLLLIPGLMAFLLAGCGRKDESGDDHSSVAAGVDFLVFPNPQASVGVGDYDLVITNNSGAAISYALNVTHSDGDVRNVSGSLGGLASTTVTFEQKHAGGMTIYLDSAGASATLRLCIAGTACTAVSAFIATATAVNPRIDLPHSKLTDISYAQAYYAAVDPANARDTLEKWKAVNGFGPCDYEVRFRDVRDLGYGRHMCWRGSTTIPGDIAVYVENFQVKAVPGQNYGPLNLEALVNDDRRWHVHTNAIEYSRINPALPVSSTNPRVLKFYTFTPAGERKLVTDLDGRGDKAMPTVCITCHGGRGQPLTSTGLFPQIGEAQRGNTLARMQPLNVDTLDFPPSGPYARVNQEAALKNINKLVLCTYPLAIPAGGPEDDCRLLSPPINNEWQATTAEMIKSWYDTGGDNQGMESPTQQDNYVPTNWLDANTGVANTTRLYREVVGPYCRVCHALRGNANQSDIDFTSYAKFIGYEARIKYHVFDKGNMPLALLKYNQFWASDAPEILADFITGAKSNGQALRPNRPVAIPGPNRVVPTNAQIKLSAAESINAASCRWQVLGGLGTIDASQSSIRPTFTAPAVNGNVTTVRLICSDNTTDSAPADFTITASSSAAVLAPSTIRFSHIKNILQNNGVTPATPCTGCHNEGSPGSPGSPFVPGIPVYYNTYDRDGVDDHQFYLDMMARINLTNVDASWFPLKPTNYHHFGGLLAGFGAGGNTDHLTTVFNWIMQGAPE